MGLSGAVVFLLATYVALAVEVPTKVLNDGTKIPLFALGTYGSDEDNAKLAQTMVTAIELGYRHFDTAALYDNEEQVGKGVAEAIRKGLVKREDLFITTKVWSDMHARKQVVASLRESLERLNLTYVDLYLIHYPMALKDDGDTPDDIDYLETWQGMEDAKKLGLTKSIGVSNFNSKQVARIIASGASVPSVNEIEVQPALTQEKLVSYLQKNGITVMAYSPFGYMVHRGLTDAPPPRIDDPILTRIGQKYGKTTTQVVLRYLIERGTIPIPKSSNKDRLRQNIDVFNFKLTPQEVAEIGKFNKNIRVLDFEGDSWVNHPYYPFKED